MLLFTAPTPPSSRRVVARARERDPVLHEQLAAEHREQDQPLHHADEAGREVGALQRVAGVLRARRAGTPRARRRTGCSARAPRRRCPCSRSSTAAGPRASSVWRKSPIWLAPPMPGDRARERHHGDDLAPRPHAGVSRRARRVADHLRLEAEARAGVEHPDPDRDHGSEDEPERDRDRADRRHRPGRRVDEHLALREDERLRRRVPPVREAVEDQVVEDERGDVVEHQRGDDLVGAQERPQQPGDRAPGGAEHGAADDHGDDQHRRRLAREQQAHAGGADRAEVQLALGADVEQAHPERDRGGEAGEGERRRGDERVRERAVREVARRRTAAAAS